MNVFWIMLDSLRRDHVGAYGSEVCKTPNIDAFAEEAIVFDNAYPEGLPTIPVRTAMVTGNRTLGSRPWQPLTDEDVTAAELLSAHGYSSAMITDTYHMAKPGMNFHRGFNSFQFIRGQEGDCWELCPHSENLDDYVHPQQSDRKRRVIDNFLRSSARWESEADTFPAQVFQEAGRMAECLSDRDKLFFWVDSFDPHEPWDPPAPYDEMYMDAEYEGPRLIDANYGDISYMTEKEQNFIRAMYAGEVTLVDRWFGHFIDTLRETGLLDRSIVIMLADHGHPHGDHGLIMKSPRNMYNELLRIPLMIRLPHAEHGGERIAPLVQTDDLLPTTLDLLGLEHEATAMTGKSAWKLVSGEAEKLRDTVVTGYHQSPIRCVRDEDYSLVVLPDGKYELYDLRNDPDEKDNIYDEAQDEARRLLEYLGYWSYTKLPPAEFENVQEAYEWAHTSIT
ncbi:MAG: sulfatase [Armatimonadota bacterium]